MTTVEDIYSKFKQQLSATYDPQEAEQVTILAFGHVLNYRRIDITMNRLEPLAENRQIIFDQILSGLISGRPIQHILGETYFHGMNLKVNQHVLIPRRETEELVDWIVKDIQNTKKRPLLIFDICTGSGCIALALKKEFPEIKIIGCDISDEALEVARLNASNENLEVEFIKLDAINISTSLKPDLVVCNPPYVMTSEKSLMNKNVIDHEPSLALFVPDNDALVFYRQISEWANKSLIFGNKIYFEINEKMGNEIRDILSQNGFYQIEIKKDFQEKDRMIKATKNGP